MSSKNETCDSPSPAMVPDRLKTALTRLEEADQCLDLTVMHWRPVAADHWDNARRLLAEARAEIESAMAPWAAH